MVAKRSLFVSFEGTEGAGKSTLIRILAHRIGALPHAPEVLVTREPGGTPVAEKIRELLLSQSMGALTELLLYEAARAEHLERTIRPALRAGHVVLCDRYIDSTLAYQGHARGLGLDRVGKANRLATEGTLPDLTVFLDVDPSVGLARATDANRFEAEGVAFQKKVRQGFLLAMKKAPRRWLHLRVRKETPEELADRVWPHFQKRWGKRWR